MHGITVGHSAALPGTATGHSATPSMAMAATSVAVALDASDRTASDHAMGAACIAIMGASLVLFLLATARTGGRPGRRIGALAPLTAALASARAGPPGGYLRPSLFQLCILRT